MKVALGKFACFCIESHFGPDIPAGVQASLRHYTRRLKSSTSPISFPDFCRDERGQTPGVEIDLELEPAVQLTLEEEAQRQTVGVEQLVSHAVFIYFSDLESSTEVGWGPLTRR